MNNIKKIRRLSVTAYYKSIFKNFHNQKVSGKKKNVNQSINWLKTSINKIQ